MKTIMNIYLGYSECTPTSAMPASSLHVFDNDSLLPAQGVFIELGIDNVDTGLRSCSFGRGWWWEGMKRNKIIPLIRLDI